MAMGRVLFRCDDLLRDDFLRGDLTQIVHRYADRCPAYRRLVDDNRRRSR
jgi:hypothetical protein